MRAAPHRVVASAAGGLRAAATAAPKRVVLWFRNDLRLHDNECLAIAAAAAKVPGTSVLPVFFLDPRLLASTRSGHRKLGSYRALFLLQSLEDLRTSLRAKGSDLLVLRERPEDGLSRLLGPSSLVLTQAEPATEEARVDAAVEAALKATPGQHELRRVWGSTLLHLDDLPLSPGLANLPTVFTPFRTLVEAPGRAVPHRPLFPTAQLPRGSLPLPADAPAAEPLPELAALGYTPEECAAALRPDPRAVLAFRGGESAGLARLQHYLFGSDALATYFDTRNGMLGADCSTKFSPWLAHGCLSPRTVASESARYERERTKNKSTYWIVFELLWRDFLHFCSVAHGRKMFLVGGFTGNRWAWRSDPAGFAAWKEGRTGHPLVDANMRELKLSGWMSNRGRQNVASFLTQNLGVDWRLGAEYFEAMLNDYDCYSNWGNWLYIAGITGGRINVFNIQKQSRDYDPRGDYVRAWLPELARVPLQYVHAPWTMPLDVQQQAGCVLGVDYPHPITKDAVRGPGGASYRPAGAGGEGGGGGGRGGGRRGGGGGKDERRSGNRGRLSEFERYGS